MSRRHVAVSWSGGKDSAMMLERLLQNPDVDVKVLVTTVSTAYDRVSIHGVRRFILHRQAELLGLPLIEVALGATSTNELYEAAFRDGLAQVQQTFPEVRTMAFGDLFLEDVKRYRETLLAKSGWAAMFPLWGSNTSVLANYFVQSGFRAIISCVDTTQLDAAFSGREYDASFLGDLPPSVDPCGERGEFHSCVFAGPIFRESIALDTGERVLREARFQYCDLVEVTDPGAVRVEY